MSLPISDISALTAATNVFEAAIAVRQAAIRQGLNEAVVVWAQAWPTIEGNSHGRSSEDGGQSKTPVASHDIAVCGGGQDAHFGAVAGGLDVGAADEGWTYRRLFGDFSSNEPGPAAFLAWKHGNDLGADSETGILHNASLGAEGETLCLIGGLCLREAMEAEAMQATLGDLRRSEQVQRALFQIADLAGSSKDLEGLMKSIHAVVGTLMYAENFYIAKFSPEQDDLHFLYYADVEDAHGPSPEKSIPMRELEGSLTWYLIRDAKPLHGTTEALRKQTSGPIAIIGPDSHDWLGVPMMRGEVCFGAVVVQSYQENVVYSEQDRAVLEFVSEHILTAIERHVRREGMEQQVAIRTQALAKANQSLRDEIEERERTERLQVALYAIATLATIDVPMATFYAKLHTIVSELIPAENFYIALVDEQQWIRFPYFFDVHRATAADRPMGRGLTELVLRTGKAWRVDGQVFQQLCESGEVDAAVASDDDSTQWWLGAPLLGAETRGVIAVQSNQSETVYDEKQAELLTFVGQQIVQSLERRLAAKRLVETNADLEARVAVRTQDLESEILARRQAEEKLKHQVLHDSLTGIPNRLYLLERLRTTLANSQKSGAHDFALIYMDVDRFKLINDSLGHPVGDAVLQEVAKRLSHSIRGPDVVARISGDEFAILLENVATPDVPNQVARRILDAFNTPIRVEGHSLSTSVSAGIAVGHHGYKDPDQLLRDADQALYDAKGAGRCRVRFFEGTSVEPSIDVLSLEHEIKGFVHYVVGK